MLLLTLLLQSTKVIDAAGQLWGPYGIILATLIVGVVGFLVWLVRDQKKMIVEIQNQRINEAKNYGVELREIERDVLDSLKDVLNLLDRLESSDVRSSKQVKELKNKLSDQHDKILTNLENLG